MRVKNKTNSLELFSQNRGTAWLRAAVAVLVLTLFAHAGVSGASAPAGDRNQAKFEPAESAMKGPVAPEAEKLAQKWGIEVASIRLTANNHMIDYRYKVLDTVKATELFNRKIKPLLIHQKSGKVLAVPETAKVGPLRNSNTPKEGKVYWMFFGNADQLVKSGDQVSVVIGDFKVENLVVQ